MKTLNIYLRTTSGTKVDKLLSFGKGAEKHGIKVEYCNDNSFKPSDYSLIFAYKSDDVNSKSHNLRQEIVDKKIDKQIFFLDSNVLGHYEKEKNIQNVYRRYPYRSIHSHEADFLPVDETSFKRTNQVKKDLGLQIKDWRKMLSNFYESEFTLDNKRWLSVEHYYQGAKFKKENPNFYEKFSLDSGSDISKDPNLAKSAGGKSGKSKGILLRPETIKMDKDFFKNERSSKEMKRAQREKYLQNEKLKEMLLLTKDAKLTHFSRGSPPIVFNETMELRKEFKNK